MVGVDVVAESDVAHDERHSRLHFLSVAFQNSRPSGVAHQLKAWAKMYSFSLNSHRAISKAVCPLCSRNALSNWASHPSARSEDVGPYRTRNDGTLKEGVYG